jgi:hypothetical protein
MGHPLEQTYIKIDPRRATDTLTMSTWPSMPDGVDSKQFSKTSSEMIALTTFSI